MNLDHDLDDAELDELHEFLGSPGLVETSLDVFGLEGFFAAVLCSPRLVMPSEWTPWIWDADRGEVGPEFADREQAERMLNLVMRFYNSVARALQSSPVEFEPLFESGDVQPAALWCGGFLAGMRFDLDAWHALAEEKPKWFEAIFGLGIDDGEEPRPRKARLERWTREVGSAVAKIHADQLERRQAREPGMTADRFAAGTGPRVRPPSPAPGRNDACSCGSGRKFKHCCGRRPAGAS